jgi:hypothetical protein
VTGREALERLRELRRLCLAQREQLAQESPDLGKVQELAERVDAVLLELPAPSALSDVDDATLAELRQEAHAVAELHRLAAYALTVLRSRHANATVAIRAADRVNAYARSDEREGGRFVDSKQ